ncbi:hypothetical protein [Cupriavidus pinatubonensis]|uniref:Uncharacterized protein n=1 Tax=Cupriavidus pinatubonensis TaxID=248026 RepID=A0ABM8Y3X6_9BURK|nr:hypothetical protein [Cupriavidus pinatubonensis]CAG9187479.1 hypothetical protein LMG23994_06924 [Cupriavidus pinatubonensis]
MGKLADYLRAYIICRRSAKAADLLWKYYGLQITDEIHRRLMCLSHQARGELSPHALAMHYLASMLEEYEGDPYAPIVHASVEFLLRRATKADAGERRRKSIHFQHLREIAERKYGWEP